MEKKDFWDDWFSGLARSLVLGNNRTPDKVMLCEKVNHIADAPELPNYYTGVFAHDGDFPV